MDTTNSDRQRWLGLLARAPDGAVAALLDEAGLTREATVLRPPEIGSVNNGPPSSSDVPD